MSFILKDLCGRKSKAHLCKTNEKEGYVYNESVHNYCQNQLVNFQNLSLFILSPSGVYY